MIVAALAVLALPFAAFVILALVPPLRRSGRPAGILSILAIAAALVFALRVFVARVRAEALWSWIPADGGPMATVGVLVDELSARCWCWSRWFRRVQVYSAGVLHDEAAGGPGPLLRYHSLFAFSMLARASPTFILCSCSGSWSALLVLLMASGTAAGGRAPALKASGSPTRDLGSSRAS